MTWDVVITTVIFMCIIFYCLMKFTDFIDARNDLKDIDREVSKND